jgi:hypothetical protein
VSRGVSAGGGLSALGCPLNCRREMSTKKHPSTEHRNEKSEIRDCRTSLSLAKSGMDGKSKNRRKTAEGF